MPNYTSAIVSLSAENQFDCSIFTNSFNLSSSIYGTLELYYRNYLVFSNFSAFQVHPPISLENFILKSNNTVYFDVNPMQFPIDYQLQTTLLTRHSFISVDEQLQSVSCAHIYGSRFACEFERIQAYFDQIQIQIGNQSKEFTLNSSYNSSIQSLSQGINPTQLMYSELLEIEVDSAVAFCEVSELNKRN